MSKKNQDQKILESAINILCEHYDSVQIFVTRHESMTKSGTTELEYGIGNYYTRFGQVSMWVKKQESTASEWVFEVEEMIEDEDEDESEETSDDDDDDDEDLC